MAKITGNTFTGNMAGVNGGAAFNNGFNNGDARMTISFGSFSGNTAGQNGGGVYSNGNNGGASLSVSGSTFSTNGATLDGGGLYNNGSSGVSDVVVWNSTFAGNTADGSGGGMANSDGTYQVTNVTIADNTAGNSGGGVNNSSGTFTINNTIVAGNSVGISSSDVDGAALLNTASASNLIGDMATAGGLTDGMLGNIVGVDWTTVLDNDGTDPILRNNGGLTDTIALLAATDPIRDAIDAGNNAKSVDADAVPFSTDQRGVSRVLDGDENSTFVVDIGAYEVQRSTVDVDGNSMADAATDGILMIRYLFGFRDDALIEGAIGTDSTATAGDVESALAAAAAMLDADGNGTADAATDGILIIRYLFGFRDAALVNGATGSGATRTTGTEVSAFLDGFLPPPQPPPAVVSGFAAGSSLNVPTTASKSVNAFVDVDEKDLFSWGIPEAPFTMDLSDEDLDTTKVDQTLAASTEWLSII